MWLASISHWRDGRNVPFEQWGNGVTNIARRLALELLDGVGDPSMERHFAMVMTFCVHRAVSDEELAAYCSTGRTSHLAGPPVKELYRTEAFPALPLTAQRCERGKWAYLHAGNQRLRVPGDCGECPPCLARLEHESA